MVRTLKIVALLLVVCLLAGSFVSLFVDFLNEGALSAKDDNIGGGENDDLISQKWKQGFNVYDFSVYTLYKTGGVKKLTPNNNTRVSYKYNDAEVTYKGKDLIYEYTSDTFGEDIYPKFFVDPVSEESYGDILYLNEISFITFDFHISLECSTASTLHGEYIIYDRMGKSVLDYKDDYFYLSEFFVSYDEIDGRFLDEKLTFILMVEANKITTFVYREGQYYTQFSKYFSDTSDFFSIPCFQFGLPYEYGDTVTFGDFEFRIFDKDYDGNLGYVLQNRLSLSLCLDTLYYRGY